MTDYLKNWRTNDNGTSQSRPAQLATVSAPINTHIFADIVDIVKQMEEMQF